VNEARARGGAPDASFWGIEPEAFGEAAQPCTLVVDVRPWAGDKLAALRCHRTQLGVRNPIAWVDVTGMRRWLGAEHFPRATISGRDRVSVLEQLGDPTAASFSDRAR
jgi:LmbE family N-acetylglucosaminyl deacetylase